MLEKQRPNHAELVALSELLGLEPATVSNYIMNARARRRRRGDPLDKLQTAVAAVAVVAADPTAAATIDACEASSSPSAHFSTTTMMATTLGLDCLDDDDDNLAVDESTLADLVATGINDAFDSQSSSSPPTIEDDAYDEQRVLSTA